jgi:uncharacterized membrane protein
MDLQNLQTGLIVIKYCVSLIGILIIISGVTLALTQYLYSIFSGQLIEQGTKINAIRLSLGRILILGLEFIVAADLIGTITAPDYYEVGMLAIIVLIRTLLTFSINREIAMIEKE